MTISCGCRRQHTKVTLKYTIFFSTSDTSKFCNKKRPINTGVCRKSLSGHNVISGTTKASGEFMASQMIDMAKSSRKLEHNKIEVQLKLFKKQMAYQRKKLRRLYENSVIANENAHLAIVKQGEVVSCLAQVSSLLSKGLFVSKNVYIIGML
jgi:ATP-dependent protease HslVU (ClpYQ) peptidase subunit